jgi:hypothetical protein
MGKRYLGRCYDIGYWVDRRSSRHHLAFGALGADDWPCFGLYFFVYVYNLCGFGSKRYPKEKSIFICKQEYRLINT